MIGAVGCRHSVLEVVGGDLLCLKQWVGTFCTLSNAGRPVFEAVGCDFFCLKLWMGTFMLQAEK